MQSEANSNVYHQILVHEMNWKRPLRFLFFVGGGGRVGVRDKGAVYYNS